MTLARTASARTRAASLASPLCAFALLLLVACGGSSSPASPPPPPPPTPPSSLVYPVNPAVYVLGSAAAANVPSHAGGAVTAFTVAPPLPAGLALDPITGAIDGTPVAVAAPASYRVTAANAGGSTSAELTITVNDRAPAIAYEPLPARLWLGQAVDPLIPSSTGGAVVAWSVAPPLPDGLALDPVTGALGGLPTAAAPAQTYTVTAANSGGQASAELTFEVAEPGPVITAFTALPGLVPAGGQALLSWTVDGMPSRVTLDGIDVSGQSSRAVTPHRRQTYTLEATNAAGVARVTVTVIAQGLELLAGHLGGPGWADGAGAEARFNQPSGMAADAAGNLYVTDFANHTLRRIGADGRVTTLAGRAGAPGSSDGPGGGASFRSPAGLAIDPAGNLYVADRGNHAIRKVTPAGLVSTLAGQASSPGSADGTGGAARFNAPSGLAWTPAGDLVVVDTGNQTVRLVTAGGAVTTLAGSLGVAGRADGTGNAATFNFPRGVAAHPDGAFYVADEFNNSIRRVTRAGAVTTLAGSPAGLGGLDDGIGGAARFNWPKHLAVDAAGDLLVTDISNRLRRVVTTTGAVTSLAGAAGVSGSADGPAASARFLGPAGVAVLGSGLVAIADEWNHAVRLYDPARQEVTTLAGSAADSRTVDGLGAGARFDSAYGLARAPSGDAFVGEYASGAVRKVSPAGEVTTLVPAGSFNGPDGLALSAAGELFVVASNEHAIYRVTPAGAVSLFAGTPGASGAADGGPGVASFAYPGGAAFDGAGNLLIADTGNGTIRRITPAGTVTTLAGTAGVSGPADGTGAAAQFNLPAGLAVDGAGNVFVGDMNNFRIRRITPAGEVTTLPFFANGVTALAFAPGGLLYAVEAWGSQVSAIDLAAGTRTPVVGVSLLAGNAVGPLPAGLAYPVGIAVTPLGDLLVTVANGLVLVTAP